MEPNQSWTSECTGKIRGSPQQKRLRLKFGQDWAPQNWNQFPSPRSVIVEKGKGNLPNKQAKLEILSFLS